MRRVTARQIRGDRTRAGRERAVIGVAISALVGYLGLFLLVRADRSVRADLAATIRFQRQEHPALARLMNAVSWFGFLPQSVLLPLSAIGGLWVLRLRLESLFLGLAWASSLLSFTTKLLVKRPRPGNSVIRVVEANIRDTSFPSGHTLHYTAFWGFFTYIVVTRCGSPAVRWMTGTVVAALTALVGPSRIYLGHHWLTDVLASYLLGTAYLFGLITLYRRVRGWLDEDLAPNVPR